MVKTRPVNEEMIRNLALWSRNVYDWASRDKLDQDDVIDLMSILFDTKVRHGFRDGYDCYTIQDNAS